jgi:uncharacterized protein
MPKYPWFRMRKKTEPELPLRLPMTLGGVSNGEIFIPKTKFHRLVEKLTFERAEIGAKRHGIDRREFLASSMGFATCLAVMNEIEGCSSNGGTTNLAPGEKLVCNDKPWIVPTEATCAESDYLTGSEFIFDIQTHSFDQGEWREKNSAVVDFLANSLGVAQRALAGCTDPEILDCYNRNHYGELMFVQSDTSMAVITSWPANTCEGDKQIGCGLPLSNEGMKELRDWLNTQAMSQRCVNQIQVMPNDRWSLQKDIMTQCMQDPAWRAISWKAYPAWKSDSYKPNGLPSGYFLNDDLGSAFIQHGLDLCVPNFAIHKGLAIPGFDVEHNQTIDVGPAAKNFPKANFIIYHSGINAGCQVTGSGLALEAGPCDESKEFAPNDDNPSGLNQLIKSLLDNGIKPNTNVFAELGTAWLFVSGAGANVTQHFMGKLLKYIGEDNIVWGTDSILVGSPQSQIMSMRAFSITQEYQDKYQYPALTDDIKKKIFGLNAARIFRIDPDLHRCKVDASKFAMVKRQMDGEFGPNRWAMTQPLGPRTPQEFLRYAREMIAKKTPG